MSMAPVSTRAPALWRATLTLLAGGVLAQALPLALGPWLTRLYTPVDFGHATLFAAVAANIAAVGCARYEFALPLAQGDDEACDLLALCLRAAVIVTVLTAAVALVLNATGVLAHALWLPLAVPLLAAVQALTQWGSRAQRFGALSSARVTQYGGGAAVQAAAGVAQAGALGLILGPVLAAAAALPWLLRPAPQGGWRGLWARPWGALKPVAQRYREFPLLNTPHAFAGALQDTLAVALLVAWSGEASAGFWGLALRYLKAPATLVGGAVSQALYPQLAQSDFAQARHAVRQVMRTLALAALPLLLVLLIAGPALFAWVFGPTWREAGELARALAPYIAAHFIAAPLAVVTMAWRAQAWALRLALVGQVMFLGAMALGLQWGGLIGAAWGVSAAMCLYFGWYFWKLATWPQPLDAAPDHKDPHHAHA
jgi:O-antigen/teichoic acid export membrane protein